MSFNGDLNASDEGTDLTTKGDIHGYSTENTRVPVGTDSYILSAASGEATGLEWIANTDAGLTLGAKGDIHTRSASNQAALAVGTNNYVLTAASGETTGLVWTDPASLKNSVALVIACGDEETAIDATGQKISFRMPYATSTNSFVTYVGHHVGGYEQFHYIIENTHGANSLNVKVQFSENGTDFFDAQGYTATAGVTVPPTTLNWNSFSSENTHHFYRVQVQSTSSGNHAGFNIYWNYVSQNN